jgi:hypothetical protein
MGEMSKVEEVARAMWSQRVKFAAEQGINLSDKDIDRMLVSNGVLEEAKAAIEAMRGPTEAMLEAGAVVDDDFSEAAPERACFMIYHAMIDAALKE